MSVFSRISPTSIRVSLFFESDYNYRLYGNSNRTIFGDYIVVIRAKNMISIMLYKNNTIVEISKLSEQQFEMFKKIRL